MKTHKIENRRGAIIDLSKNDDPLTKQLQADPGYPSALRSCRISNDSEPLKKLFEKHGMSWVTGVYIKK
jgi:hypothetical protein